MLAGKLFLLHSYKLVRALMEYLDSYLCWISDLDCLPCLIFLQMNSGGSKLQPEAIKAQCNRKVEIVMLDNRQHFPYFEQQNQTLRWSAA